MTDANTKAPIAGATVRSQLMIMGRTFSSDTFTKAPRQEVVTSESGDYSMSFTASLTASGQYKDQDGILIDVSAKGYETRADYGRLRPGRTSRPNTDIPLAPGRRLTGKVVDESGAPVAGAQVKAGQGRNGSWEYFGSTGLATTGSDGTFEMWVTKDKEADYAPRWLTFWKAGYGWAFTFDLDKDDLGTITVKPGATLAGKVLGPDGKPAAGVQVFAENLMFYVVAEGTTSRRRRL